MFYYKKNGNKQDQNEENSLTDNETVGRVVSVCACVM